MDLQMKIKIILLLLLISSNSISEVNDSYFCSKLSASYISEYEVIDLNNKKELSFYPDTLKFIKTNTHIIFPEDSHSSLINIDNVSGVRKLPYNNRFFENIFYGGGKFLNFNYIKDILFFNRVDATGHYSTSAMYECSKF